ncbi:MAG: hypothetical protein AUJ34_01295 [Parcubacteria group bacterium CG1_02_41_12]|nr:MAG: hypothetical protein AUJ34_01295 [Parcubacteria group bacterium CG1_02_41_12]
MKQQKPVIILFGPQGSGKGTQGKKLTEKLNIPYLETGQLLRNEIATGSEDGKRFASYMDKGNLVPPEDAIALMSKKITQAVSDKGGAVIDGFPRSAEQAKGFPEDINLTHVLLIDLEDKESIRRLSARRNCPKDKKIYNMITNPPKNNETCDDCGTKLVQRDDDFPKAIQQRLDVYHRDTEPLIERYKKMGLLHRINGMPSIEEVEKEIWKIFE